MTPLEQLKTMLHERYHTYKNEEYTIELMPGLSDEEIDTVARQLPGRQVPAEIRELLQFTSGFLFSASMLLLSTASGNLICSTLFPSRCAWQGTATAITLLWM